MGKFLLFLITIDQYTWAILGIPNIYFLILGNCILFSFIQNSNNSENEAKYKNKIRTI